MSTLAISKVRLETLTPDPDNARLHVRRNLDAIKASLARFGQTRPLVVTEDGLMIAGNGTLAAALKLGWDEVEVTRVPFRNQDEARAFALADNRTGELAQWNVPVLLQALESLALEGWRLEEIGFAPEDLAAWRRRQASEAPDELPVCGEDDSTFPADYVLAGSYREGQTRVGNSVPPVILRAVAAAVRDEVLNRIG